MLIGPVEVGSIFIAICCWYILWIIVLLLFKDLALTVYNLSVFFTDGPIQILLSLPSMVV